MLSNAVQQLSEIEKASGKPVDSSAMPTRKQGAPAGNLNAAVTLSYAHDIEERIDGRSLLALGFQAHRSRLLKLFNAGSLEDLDGLEREAVRRLVKRRVIRELAWGRVQTAFEQQDIEAFNIEVPRFQDAVNAEERTEARLESLLSSHNERVSAPSLEEYIESRDARTPTSHEETTTESESE